MVTNPLHQDIKVHHFARDERHCAQLHYTYKSLRTDYLMIKFVTRIRALSFVSGAYLTRRPRAVYHQNKKPDGHQGSTQDRRTIGWSVQFIIYTDCPCVVYNTYWCARRTDRLDAPTIDERQAPLFLPCQQTNSCLQSLDLQLLFTTLRKMYTHTHDLTTAKANDYQEVEVDYTYPESPIHGDLQVSGTTVTDLGRTDHKPWTTSHRPYDWVVSAWNCAHTGQLHQRGSSNIGTTVVGHIRQGVDTGTTPECTTTQSWWWRLTQSRFLYKKENNPKDG